MNIDEVPVTTVRDDVYVVEMRGRFNGYTFNNERLMGIKCSNYLAAVQPNEKGKEKANWHEVIDSKRPIDGAIPLKFKGSYTEFSRSGLRNNEMKFGFRALMYALMGLFKKKKKSCFDFLTVCVNLFEPARYPIIGRELILHLDESILLPKYFIELIYSWKKLSKSVLDCQKDKKKVFVFKIGQMRVKVYWDDGIMRYKTFTLIQKEDVHMVLGMVKCSIDEEKED